MGKLIALMHTAPGDVVYMRPDHPVYEPGNFALVVENHAPESVRVLFLDPSTPARCLFKTTDEAVRCVERVGSELAAKCEGMPREELRHVCAALRAGDTDRDPTLQEDGLMRRVLNAIHGAVQPAEVGTVCAPYVDDMTDVAPNVPRSVDPGPIALDGPRDTEWQSKAGPFGDP